MPARSFPRRSSGIERPLRTDSGGKGASELKSTRNRLMDLDVRFQLVIGRMVIAPASEGKVWLTWVDSGEGMEIEEAKLAACLEQFYADNF
jgi:hypothetical protein